jgi:integrase
MQRGWPHRSVRYAILCPVGRNPSNLRHRSFHMLLERAGLPRMRFHDLRASAATLLLGMGIHPKIVSELLGHTQVSITLDVYSHVPATMQRDAITALEELLGRMENDDTGSGVNEWQTST